MVDLLTYHIVDVTANHRMMMVAINCGIDSVSQILLLRTALHYDCCHCFVHRQRSRVVDSGKIKIVQTFTL